ncbi:MAG: hypothetical protein ACHQSE_16145 [Gemmatimonadales bacterium]
MAKKRKRHREPNLVPRLGPATNLRPAGAHEDKKHYDRKKIKAVLRREPEDGFDNSAVVR